MRQTCTIIEIRILPIHNKSPRARLQTGKARPCEVPSSFAFAHLHVLCVMTMLGSPLAIGAFHMPKIGGGLNLSTQPSRTDLLIPRLGSA